jgi:phenylalanyl-tRNA synthetase beta chain
MKVCYNWLKDFVEIKITPQLLAEKLTMAGLEVTSLQERGGDFVFEIEVTSNRPDCLSVIGIAREVAAITNSKLKVPGARCQVPGAKKQLPFYIKIEDKKDCPLYTAKVIREVKVGPSPDWLKERLELLACRSVNNVVDITNYILFTWGEPLHAFDLDRLDSGGVMVRRGKAGEKLVTIDGEEKALNRDILVIADKKKAVAAAGIMGGKETEVSGQTKNILLEAAVFNPVIVRRGRRALGLESESAYRFERGINLEAVEKASWAAVELIEKVAAGRCVLAQASGRTSPAKKHINLEVARAHKILGIKIPAAEIKKILTRLGFKVKRGAKNNFKVEIPSFRQDAHLEIDLIEEIARIFGYADLPTTVAQVKPQPAINETRDLVSLIKNMLAGLGLNEVITYSLIDKDLLKGFEREKAGEVIEILNPLSKEQEVLRPLLMPSLASCVAYNLRKKQTYINIFEIAKTYFNSGGQVQEQYSLGIALCGARSLWFAGGQVQDEAGFLHLKGILEAVFKRLGLGGDYKFISKGSGDEFEVRVKNDNIGILRRLGKETLERMEIKNKEVFVLEIALEKLLSHIRIEKRVVPLARYPGISRDISLSLKEDITIEQIQEVIMQRGGNLLREAAVTDYYKGKPIEPGYKGLTISCLYCSVERTLTEAEIDPIHADVVKALEGKFKGLKIR